MLALEKGRLMALNRMDGSGSGWEGLVIWGKKRLKVWGTVSLMAWDRSFGREEAGSLVHGEADGLDLGLVN